MKEEESELENLPTPPAEEPAPRPKEYEEPREEVVPQRKKETPKPPEPDPDGNLSKTASIRIHILNFGNYR